MNVRSRAGNSRLVRVFPANQLDKLISQTMVAESGIFSATNYRVDWLEHTIAVLLLIDFSLSLSLVSI